VVDNVHTTGGGGSRGSVDAAAGEARVGDVVGGFEVVGEFVEDVVYFACVGAVVYGVRVMLGY
jgi:hypothetical protein